MVLVTFLLLLELFSFALLETSPNEEQGGNRWMEMRSYPGIQRAAVTTSFLGD